MITSAWKRNDSTNGNANDATRTPRQASAYADSDPSYPSEAPMIAEQIDSVRHVTERLFSALQRRDAAAIAACYDKDAIFCTPVLGEVLARDLEALWRAVSSITRAHVLTYAVVDVGLTSARVDGVVTYAFAPSGRVVTSDFSSILQVRDARIVCHEDTFDPWGWARMAYGTRGLMFGWSRAWRRRMQRVMRASLDAAAGSNLMPKRGAAACNRTPHNDRLRIAWGARC